jgi:hypothetical protein
VRWLRIAGQISLLPAAGLELRQGGRYCVAVEQADAGAVGSLLSRLVRGGDKHVDVLKGRTAAVSRGRLISNSTYKTQTGRCQFTQCSGCLHTPITSTFRSAAGQPGRIWSERYT